MTIAVKLQAPFPWFGGKSRAAHLVWERFGDPAVYTEPFFGSGAVLLGRPDLGGAENVNDLDGFVANFWRALQADPDAVAKHADWPVNECDLHARHVELVGLRAGLSERLMGDASFYDARVAGWWVWGQSSWIGGGWCSGQGPWTSVGGRFVLRDGNGQGVHRQFPHLGGRGVHRQLPHLGNDGRGDIVGYMRVLAERLRGVRVACGDWRRVCGPAVVRDGAVFLDPPYSHDLRDGGCYAVESSTVAAEVRAWALEHQHLRVALCGYEGEHEMPSDWECVAWKAKGGYGVRSDGRGRENATKERIWFSPACLRGGQVELWR